MQTLPLQQERPSPGDDKEAQQVAQTREALRSCMWQEVGLVRSDAQLARAARRIHGLQQTNDEALAAGKTRLSTLELRNLLQVAALIVRSAMQRHESRGLHFNRDHPDTLAEARPTVLSPSH
jgi:L-aspartate oxidase